MTYTDSSRARSCANVRLSPAIALSAFILLLLSFTITGAAQQITGTVVGTIKDQQGAVVPSASVTATNLDTGFTRTVTSNGTGDYRIDYLPVGRYKVDAGATGFQQAEQQNVQLSVDQTQTLNFALPVGAQTQTVTVTSAAPLVNTTTAELGRTVQPAEITGLPLVNRNVYTELSLTPGVQSNSASSNSNTPNFQVGVPSTQVVVNGGIDAGVPMVSYYLDGGVNTTGIRNYGNQLPDPDALREFRVETNNFSAQYGRMSGAVVTAVTQSGTNHFHGSLFEFVRNTGLNAIPWNAPHDVHGNRINDPYHRNQFGGTIGGPVKHDRAFFFFSHGGLRQSTGTFLSGAVVPTALERTGNFSQSATKPIDPATGQPYNYNGVAGWIPPSALDPTATNIINKYIPTSNGPKNSWNGFFTGPTDDDEFLGKYDQVLSDKNHLMASYFNIHTTQNTSAGGNLLWSTQQSASRQQNVNISDVYSLTPNTANQAWVTFTRVLGGRVNLPALSLHDLGSSFQIQGPPSLPQISVSGYFTLGQSFAGAVTGSDFYSVRDMLTSTKGKHTLNYGFEISLDHDMVVGNLENWGNFSFSPSTPGSTKNSLADFLTGKVGSMEQDTPYHGLISSWYYGFFIQDDYRVHPRLTLNLGLRYDLQTPPTESQNLTETFIPGRQSTVIPSAPRGVLFPGDQGVPRGITNLRKHHFAPRLGLAWDPFGNGKMAIRAGVGVFYGSVTGNEWNQPANAQPFAVRQVFSSIASLTNVYGNPASFPNGSPFPYNYTPQNPRFLPAASVETISQNYQWPLTYQMNFAVERQLPKSLSVTAAYVGSLSHDLPFTNDANYPAWAPGATTSQTSVNSRRPYDPGILGQTQYLESNQTASYHSLQISAHRPLTKNLLLNGYYVFSKSFWSASMEGVGIGGSTQDYNNLKEERGPSDDDYRHMVSISGIWNVDYYHGGSGLLKQIANGWTISPIVTLNSGRPVNMQTGADNNADTYNSDRPNLVAGQNAFLDPHRGRTAAAAAWFNTKAFSANGPGKGIGIGGADGTTPRDYLRAPGYRDIDLGLFRDFRFEHGWQLQLRGEASNAFNLTNLGAPTASLASSLDGVVTAPASNSNRQIQVGARMTF